MNPSRSSHLQRFCNLLSSGCGSGYARRAPGTWGSLAALLLWLLAYYAGSAPDVTAHLWITLVVTAVGVCVVHQSLRGSASSDPGWIVIDEWAGMSIALLGVNFQSGSQLLVAFAAFRFFDVVKPGPVRWAERVPGAVGVMADDLVAGVAACGVVQILVPLAHRLGEGWGGLVW